MTTSRERWLAAAAIPLLVVCNYLWFQRFGSDYLSWYMRSGPWIGVITALFAAAWGDMDRNVMLISPRPSHYVAACLLVVSLPFVALGTQIESLGASMRRSGNDPARWWLVLDAALMLPFLLAVTLLLFLWLLVIAPLQYFTFLVCGALPRVLLRSPERIIAHTGNGPFDYQTARIADAAPVPKDWWDASISRKPVTLAAGLSSLLLFVLRALMHM